MTSNTSADLQKQLSAELNRLIVRRLRIGLGVILAGVVLFVIADHLLMAAVPRWTLGLNALAAGLVAAAFWLLGLPAIRARPVPFALLIVALTCSLRALAGIWFGDLAPTAILCVVVALTAGVTLPWGVWPQLASVAFAVAAIVGNAYMTSGQVDQPAHLVAAVVTALLVSVVLSFELQRNRLRFIEENLQRRRAEDDLARLNAELELRVADRTAELVAATQCAQREARERQQAAHELRESQKRLQDILDNAAAAIYLKDVDGRYLLLNRHCETVMGLRREDAVGKTLHDVFPSETADALRANDHQVLASRRPLQVEETVLQRDGQHIHLSVKFPLFDSAGSLVGVCGISTDITGRKQMEAELHRSQAALSALVENTTDAIWSIDRNYEITAFNAIARERFRERFGAPFDAKSFAECTPPGVWEGLRALYDRALAGERVQIEQSFQAADGVRHVLFCLHPIVDNGTVTGAAVFSKELTEHKRTEEQARQHQAELAHVLRLRTMGEMAAGLAHEINQPLGAIANYAQGCVRRLRAGSTDAAALLPIVEEIAGEALRAGEIIRRLRDLVRKDSPQQEAVDVNALVRKSAQMIEPEARQQGISVHLELASDLPPVTGDAIQIEQVLLNLLLNGVEAVQASSNGARTLDVTTAPAGSGIEVLIRDSGIGVPNPPADVFTPFFTTKPNGLGMGLSISRSIIEAHGGSLSAAANQDCGSTFRFTLPVRGDAV